MRYWEKFCRQFQADVRLWLLMMLGLSVFRLIMIGVYRDHLSESGSAANVAASLLVGLRFDTMACTYFMLPAVLLAVLCGFWNLERIATRWRSFVVVAYAVLTPIVCCGNIEYYREFHDNFNQFLFNAWYDNKPALLSTAIDQYNLLQHLITVAVVAYGVVCIQRRYFNRPFLSDETVLKYMPGHLSRGLVGLVIAAVVIVGLRGSAGRAPVGPGKSAVTPEALLNKAAINPYMALLYAAKVQLSVIGEGGLKMHLPDEDIVGAVRRLFPDAPRFNDIDRIMLRTAAGPKNEPPKHIFMIGMESYDSWPLMDKYRSLGITEQLRGLAKGGLHVQAFLPSDEYSMRFANTVITGLPEAGIQTNWQFTAQKPFPSSLPDTMRKLGYRTRFFCGAPLDWQNCQHFCKVQGFDEVYGSLDIVRGTNSEITPNLWAAPDELLWKFIDSKIQDDEPSFTFVFSSSYHVPYDIDLEAAGCPLKEVPADLESAWAVPREAHLRKLGHLWYADKCLGEFVHAMENRVTRPVFAITGDHFGRNFINGKPTLYEKASVPLVLYGKQVLAGIKLPEGVAGGHVDLPATLIELTAPRGFRYHAFGQNLLVPQKRFFAYGSGRVLGHNYIAEVDRPDVLQPIPGRELPKTHPDIDTLDALYRAARGVSWWRLKRGPELPAANVQVASEGKILR